MKVWDRAGIDLPTPGSAVKHTSVARHVTEKTMWHAIYSHVLTGTKPSHAVVAHLFDFMYTHSGAVTKRDIININEHRSEHNLVTSELRKCLHKN